MINESGAAWQLAMRQGDFAAAWRINDAVLSARDLHTCDNPAEPYHKRWVWDGTPPDGRDVLVRCYHGLGDTIQFARFLPLLRTRAKHLTLECQPELTGLLSQLGCLDQSHPFNPACPLPPRSCTAEIMELGHMLRATATEVGAAVPYFTASPASGLPALPALCWAAGDWDGTRSLPLEILLQTLGDGRFISLQRGSQTLWTTADLFINPHDDDRDVLRTASLIRASSQIITVDTMVAHLAGSLGHAGAVLLKAEPDWRWSKRDGRSVWYPSLRLLDIEDLRGGNAEGRQAVLF